MYTRVIGLGLCALVAGAPSQGQSQATVEQVETRFDERRAPLSAPGRIIPAYDPLEVPSAASAVLFILGGITLIGNTAITDVEILPFYRDLLNQEIPVSTIFALANRITGYYGERGYPLSRALIPAQDIGPDGVVVVRIVEGFVDRVVSDNDEFDRNAILQGHAVRLTQDRPITSAVIERQLLLSDDLPGLGVRSVLRRSDEVQGASTIVLDIDEEPPIRYSFNVDNRGTDSIGPFQAEASVSVSNLFHSNSQTRLRFANASASRELLFLELNHDAVLSSSGLRLLLGVRGSRALPGGENFRAIELESKSTTAFAELRFPAIRSRSQNLELFGRIEARNAETSALGSLLSRDRVRTVGFGLDYDRSDELGGLNSFSLAVRKGLSGLGANSNDDPLNSRANGQVDYLTATLDLSRNQRLGAISEDLASWSVFGQIRAQATGTPLLSSEECSLGGSEIGRAFDPSTLSGDRCVAGLVELRYQVDRAGFWDDLQLYGFADAGSVSDIGGESSFLSSAGLGARFGLMDNYRGSIEVSRQMQNTGGGIDTKSPRLFVSFSGEF